MFFFHPEFKFQGKVICIKLKRNQIERNPLDALSNPIETRLWVENMISKLIEQRTF